jgi:RimJ/RimL family protein N-acetyltransferase
LLEGKTVNLRVVEREDTDFMVECFNDIDYWGEYDSITEQKSTAEQMKQFDNPPVWVTSTDMRGFVILKKDGTRIGFISHWRTQPSGMTEIGYHIVPNERGKGYGTETVQLMVDYLFLSSGIVRIQATTNVKNRASQRVLEKAGFKLEGTCRKTNFVRGVWTDNYLYSILRDDWKEPKILTRTI